jgi:ferredoxin--NADP+ reductase
MMMNESSSKNTVAVIGAGPAGLYAARHLAEAGVEVALFNRDIKPGGLAEYGIYYDKYKMKSGLRRQFRAILENPNIHYFGNVKVGRNTDLKLSDLRKLGFQGIMITVGAQGTKWLGLPGEDRKGVYHAKDIVYHYNKLPPFSTKEYPIGERVALIGVGGVMMDMAHWMIRDKKVREVIAVARRGPAEVKFTQKDMMSVACNLDLDALNAEIARVTPYMEAVDQSPEEAKQFILAALPKALDPVSDTVFRFEFLASPRKIITNPAGCVCGLEVEDTELVEKNGGTKAQRLGTKRVLEIDSVIFCIGDRVDENLGLPVKWNEYVKNPSPLFPINGLSYEAFDPDKNSPIDGIFVAGWAREASRGLVGVARKDGENGAKAMESYLQTLQPSDENVMAALNDLLAKRKITFVNYEDILRLEKVEHMEADRLGVEDYKMKSNAEMLDAIF